MPTAAPTDLPTDFMIYCYIFASSSFFSFGSFLTIYQAELSNCEHLNMIVVVVAAVVWSRQRADDLRSTTSNVFFSLFFAGRRRKLSFPNRKEQQRNLSVNVRHVIYTNVAAAVVPCQVYRSVV